jgi:hypothetical protein
MLVIRKPAQDGAKAAYATSFGSKECALANQKCPAQLHVGVPVRSLQHAQVTSFCRDPQSACITTAAADRCQLEMALPPLQRRHRAHPLGPAARIQECLQTSGVGGLHSEAAEVGLRTEPYVPIRHAGNVEEVLQCVALHGLCKAGAREF